MRKIKELELASGVRLDAGIAPARLRDATTLTLERFFHDQYEPWHRSQYPASNSKLHTCWKSLRPHFGADVLSDITTERIESWKAARSRQRRTFKLQNGKLKDSGRCISNETVRKEYNQLRAMMRRAVLWGKLKQSPCAGVERIPKAKSVIPCCRENLRGEDVRGPYPKPTQVVR